MFSWLLSLLSSPILGKITDYLTTRANTELGKYQGDVTVAVAAVQAEIASRNAQKEIILAEQGRWYTAMIRPLMAFPLVLYLWKTIAYDKVMCKFVSCGSTGITDAVGGSLGEWIGIIIISYFGTSMATDIAGKIVRALRGR